jgi:spore coat protein SA
MMNIALVCTEKLPIPPISGGAIQIYIDGILPFIAEHHQVTVFGRSDNRLPDEEISGNVRFKRVAGRNKLEYLSNICNAMTDEYQLIHVFNRPLWVMPISNAVPTATISLSLHNEMFLPGKIDSNTARQCIDKVRFITTVSKFIADGVENLYPSAGDKLNVVYSGVDCARYVPVYSDQGAEARDALRREYGLENHRVVLYVGRLGRKKGPHVLIEAMKYVMAKHPDTALVFVGSKWYGSNEEDSYTKQLQIMTQQLEGPVVFTGFLPPSEIPRYYGLGDVFVCVSQWREPLARIHYEAMAAGLPIITTKRGGNAEVVETGVNGIVVKDYDNPEAVAESICYLVENEERALEMGRTGRRLAEQSYGWERVAKQLLDLIDGI